MVSRIAQVGWEGILVSESVERMLWAGDGEWRGVWVWACVTVKRAVFGLRCGRFGTRLWIFIWEDSDPDFEVIAVVVLPGARRWDTEVCGRCGCGCREEKIALTRSDNLLFLPPSAGTMGKTSSSS